ncbi:transcription elongation factor 1 homolog [Megaptera novaeangliae]
MTQAPNPWSFKCDAYYSQGCSDIKVKVEDPGKPSANSQIKKPYNLMADVVCRKSKQKPPPKKKMTGSLDVEFTCPFCNHEKSCDMKMDQARNTGVISCTMCLEEFQTPITYLSEPVDVYSDLIDSCEAANH